jgi:hypothetical protein
LKLFDDEAVNQYDYIMILRLCVAVLTGFYLRLRLRVGTERKKMDFEKRSRSFRVGVPKQELVNEIKLYIILNDKDLLIR